MIALKVREFTSAEDIIAHAKACRERIRNAKARPKPIAPTIIVPQTRKPVLPPKPEGLNIYAWPIGPRHERDYLYVATPKNGKVATAQQIIREVCAKTGFSISEVKSQRRKHALCMARHEIFYRMKHETEMSFPQMGRMLGNRDHTTALHSVKRFTELLADGTVTL